MSTAGAHETDTQADLFGAAERLLEHVPLHNLSVAQIIEEAGVSRATFYFYFSSKYGVIAGMLERIMEEVYDVARPFVESPEGESPEVAMRKGIDAGAALWRKHRPAMRAVAEHWHSVPEIGTLWLQIFERFTDAFAGEIDRQRQQGVAPPGPPSRELAATLLWSTERCFYVGGLGVDEGLPSEEVTAEALYALWHGTIYGGLPAAKPPSRKTPR